MSKVRVHNLSMSIDGFVAGPNQGPDHPLGVGGLRLHQWVFSTRSFRRMQGLEGDGEVGIDDDFAAQGDHNLGATVMGRNMFGPIRGPWEDEAWRGWWGEDPPFHHPVFVLTNHPRPSLTMEGGTTFHFITDGIEVALERAREAADSRDVRIGGGASTIQQFLRAGLIDELHIAVIPILLGAGERLFDGVGAAVGGLEATEFVASTEVAHVRFTRTTT